MNTKTLFLATAGLLLTAVAQSADAQPAAVVTQPAQDHVGTDGVFAALDTNKDGTVSRLEFQAGYPGLARAFVVELRLRDQFQLLDANRSGAIEASEYANLELVKRTDKNAPGFATFDINKNQKLEFPEYIAAVRQLTAQAPVKK